jgi:laccase
VITISKPSTTLTVSIGPSTTKTLGADHTDESLPPSASIFPARSNGKCKNSRNKRGCWGDGYNITTDVMDSWPDTGVTRSYNFTITNGTLAPNGVERQGFLINGQYPGPTIFADWGDWIEVSVTNEMQYNGTTLHWHGFRQFYTNGEDGVPGVTECPIAPGQSKTYRFQATQHGTSWYHSHLVS